VVWQLQFAKFRELVENGLRKKPKFTFF